MTTTIALVKEIIDTDQIDSVIQSLIDAADNYLTLVYANVTINATLLNEIGRWFVAHMLASTHDRMGKKEKIGEASIEYTGTFANGLQATTYGQMIITLDTTGTITNAPKRKVKIVAISEDES